MPAKEIGSDFLNDVTLGNKKLKKTIQKLCIYLRNKLNILRIQYTICPC